MFLNATQFFSWGQSCAMVSRQTSRHKDDFFVSDFAMAGLYTAIACAMVESPIDFFKTQLQVQVYQKNPQFRTVPQAFSYVLRNKGIMGAYHGLSATLIRNLPFRSSYFGTYEIVRRKLLQDEKGVVTVKRGHEPHHIVMFAGGMAGFTQWFFCYPLDVIKSNMQGDNIDKTQRKYNNWADCVRKLYKQGGPRMFFRGFTPCMLRSFPANAACYLVYEQTVHFLQRY
jgi:solute carrier family 25 carnitine/acylcarnitine transporter 20/29